MELPTPLEMREWFDQPAGCNNRFRLRTNYVTGDVYCPNCGEIVVKAEELK